MSKNFNRNNKLIERVSKNSNESANTIQVKMLKDELLLDFQENNEDITKTEDLEQSMREQGFTDPIEVTDFNTEKGKYTILSGHRRRRAAINVGITVFPCIIKNFQNENEMKNYILMANSQRDSSKDPLLFCKRYKMHEAYLKQINFKGSIREEIAKRLGISVQQSDRYNQFNKVIIEGWDMVLNGFCGMNSLLSLATYEHEDQKKIIQILKDYMDIEKKERISREKCSELIKSYKNGITYEDIKKEKDEIVNEKIDTKEVKEILTIKENHSPQEQPKNDDDITIISYIENTELENKEIDEKDTETDINTEEALINSEKSENVELNLIKKHKFKNKKDLIISIKEMNDSISIAITEMYKLSKEYKLDKDFKEFLNDLQNTISNYI